MDASVDPSNGPSNVPSETPSQPVAASIGDATIGQPRETLASKLVTRRKMYAPAWVDAVYDSITSHFPAESRLLYLRDGEQKMHRSISYHPLYEVIVPTTSSGKLGLSFDLNSSIRPDLQMCHERQNAIRELASNEELRSSLSKLVTLARTIEFSSVWNGGREVKTPTDEPIKEGIGTRFVKWFLGDPIKRNILEDSIIEFKSVVQSLPEPTSDLLKETVSSLRQQVEFLKMFCVVNRNPRTSEFKDIAAEIQEYQKNIRGWMYESLRFNIAQERQNILHFGKKEGALSEAWQLAYGVTGRVVLNAITTASVLGVGAFAFNPSAIGMDPSTLGRVIGGIVGGVFSLGFFAWSFDPWTNHSENGVSPSKRGERRRKSFQSLVRNSSESGELFSNISQIDFALTCVDILKANPETTCIPEVHGPEIDTIEATSMIGPKKRLDPQSADAAEAEESDKEKKEPETTVEIDHWSVSRCRPLLITGRPYFADVLSRAYTQNQLMAEIGAPVFAKSFSTVKTDNFAYLDCSKGITYGLKNSLAFLTNATPSSVLILDGLAEQASHDESSHITRRLLAAFASSNVFTVMQTQNLETVHDLSDLDLIDAVRSRRDESNKYNILFTAGIADNSGAESLAKAVGADEASLKAQVAAKGGDIDLLKRWSGIAAS